ncbi:hypothetical protein QQF64_009341 [Cirrhinus molitorella]|uniref:TRAM domain-containing protein n=1 Tax=Cirrhinus molitorella TaxID=172907 RepID=A0ABR3M4A2_9TELE
MKGHLSSVQSLVKCFDSERHASEQLRRTFISKRVEAQTIGERQRVLVTEESFDSQYYVAHNKFYEQVLVPKKSEFKGKMIEVDIYEAGKHYMKGRPVEDAQVFTPSIAQPLQKGQVSGLPQELKASHQNGVCASVASSALMGRSWRFDGDGLKLLSLGLALAALIVALVIDKLH